MQEILQESGTAVTKPVLGEEYYAVNKTYMEQVREYVVHDGKKPAAMDNRAVCRAEKDFMGRNILNPEADVQFVTASAWTNVIIAFGQPKFPVVCPTRVVFKNMQFKAVICEQPLVLFKGFVSKDSVIYVPHNVKIKDLVDAGFAKSHFNERRKLELSSIADEDATAGEWFQDGTCLEGSCTKIPESDENSFIREDGSDVYDNDDDLHGIKEELMRDEDNSLRREEISKMLSPYLRESSYEDGTRLHVVYKGYMDKVRAFINLTAGKCVDWPGAPDNSPICDGRTDIHKNYLLNPGAHDYDLVNNDAWERIEAEFGVPVRPIWCECTGKSATPEYFELAVINEHKEKKWFCIKPHESVGDLVKYVSAYSASKPKNVFLCAKGQILSDLMEKPQNTKLNAVRIGSGFCIIFDEQDVDLTKLAGGEEKKFKEPERNYVPPPKTREKLQGVVGLENIGNTCFMNAALQCLAHTDALCKYFIENKSEDAVKNEGLVSTFAMIVCAIMDGSISPVRPQIFKEELAKLYQEEKINPISSCLPMLLQFPIFIALYGLLNKNFDLRGAMFIPGWIPDLSLPDTVATLPFNIPLLGNSIHLLPIIYTVSMIFSMKITQTTTTQGQKGMMWFMTYGMPIMFFFVMYNAPSGLLVYWTITNFISILQQLRTNKKKGKVYSEEIKAKEEAKKAAKKKRH